MGISDATQGSTTMDEMRRRHPDAGDEKTQRRVRRGLSGWESFAILMGGAILAGALVSLLLGARVGNGGLVRYLLAEVGIVIVALLTARPWRRR